MQVIAIAKNVRMSPEKARLVVVQIKKMSPIQALGVLNFVPKASAPIIKKVIQSAIANAKHNFNLVPESLVFKEITVGKGPVFKRYRAVARGRAHSILKRTSHIRVVLEDEKRAQSEQQSIADKKSEHENSKFKVQNSKLQ